MSAPTTGYVTCWGKRWIAGGGFRRDGVDWIKLRRYNPGTKAWTQHSAPAEEVTAWQRPAATRKLRDEDYVLEFGPRGAMTIRAVRSPTRYTTSLAAIYHSAVKLAVSLAKAQKRINKRKGR